MPGPPSIAHLDDPRLYINRELSQLEFNARVLALSREPSVPLLERLRFLTITSSNLDEFFEVRVGGVKQRIGSQSVWTGPDGLSSEDVLRRISVRAHELVATQYRILNEELLPALGREGIHLLRRSEWTPKQRAWTVDYFREQVAPLLTPVALDPAHPFPAIVNKALTFVVHLDGSDPFGRTAGVAVVQVPRVLPRILLLPSDPPSERRDFVLISSVIHAQVAELFPGLSVLSCHQFRITRDSDLWVDEEEMVDLMDAVKGQLAGRRYGDAVRLEVADNCPLHIARLLLDYAGLSTSDLFQVNGPVNMVRLGYLIDQVDRPDLKWPSFNGGVPLRRDESDSVLGAIARRDVLLHHPYESFAPVVELLEEAARDPDVLAIKQTLYRTGAASPVIAALAEAARNGKEVTVVFELMARFDEAENIAGATRLRDAGANVVYGIVGYKSHAKMLLIVRREHGKLRRYVHVGTGNYHVGTARLYTDLGLLTADPEIVEDVHHVFVQLTSIGRGPTLKALWQAPFSLASNVRELVSFETAEAKAGRPARIVARLNAISDEDTMHALYRASAAGVTVDLLVRGVCCLRPGVPGLSPTLRVRSVLGRFLEHSRVFLFHHGGEELVYLSSADWMFRNLHRRVEIAVPVRDPVLKRRVIEESLSLPWQDTLTAWDMQSNGSYERVRPADGKPPQGTQQVLLQRLAEHPRGPLPAAGRRAGDEPHEKKKGKGKKRGA